MLSLKTGKFALATALFLFLAYLGMKGKLVEFLSFAKSKDAE